MTLLLIHLAATWWMVGLIWFVQVVHYPLFAGVAAERFAAYETAHQQRTSWVVGPPMLTELAATIVLLVHRPAGVGVVAPWLGAGLLAAIWLSTALVQMRQHRGLSEGFDGRLHRQLVGWNWPRTILWTARGVVAAAMVQQAAAAS